MKEIISKNQAITFVKMKIIIDFSYEAYLINNYTVFLSKYIESHQFLCPQNNGCALKFIRCLPELKEQQLLFCKSTETTK